MQAWQRAALVASVCIALHYLLLRGASGRLPDVLGALILESSAALGILAYFVFGPKNADATTNIGIGLSIASGFAISAASILIFFALRRGGPVAATGTIVLGGGVAISALAAPFLFAEGFTWRRFIGVSLGILAMIVLSTERVDSP